MNISDLITHYVAFRRTLGERCRTNEFLLRAFCRAVGPRTKVSKIRLKDVNAFLACPKALTRTWHCKYFALKGFFKFAISRGHLNKAPLPTEVPKLPPTVVPYIYSRAEIRRLLDAIPLCRPFASRMGGSTMRAILLTVYGAGLRRSEVLNLSVEDVDLSNALLTIRNTKFFKSRLVPISSDLTKVLNDYARWRATTHPSARSGTFFVNTRGEPVHRCTLHKAFTQLREHAGVQRSDGGRYQPRLHDLRHAFAVHRLTRWYQQGADVQRLISTSQGCRDHALLLFMYNAGTRADETAQVRIEDLTLPHVPGRDGASVLIRGKGNKKRRCPLWAQTVRELTELIRGRGASEHVFLNRCGRPITRFGIHTLVERSVARAVKKVPTLATKRVSPHTIRHTTATHLLRSGVDINTIRAWLGHVSLETTNVYAEVDLEMKAKALANCEVEGAKKSHPWKEDKGLMEFLRTL